MKRIARQWKIGRFWFYIGVIGLIAAVLSYQYFMGHRTQIWGEPIEKLTALQEKQLEAFLSMNQFLIALGTALLGAMGFLLINRRKGTLPRHGLWTAVFSAVFAGLSLFFGYKGYDDLVWMLQSPYPTFDLYGPLIHGDRIAHFVTLMVSGFLFADFVFHELSQEEGNDQSDDIKGP
jgi:hypothetical protein